MIIVIGVEEEKKLFSKEFYEVTLYKDVFFQHKASFLINEKDVHK